MPREWVARTIAAIADDAFRDAPGPEPDLAETKWALSIMRPEALERLSTFLSDLTRRAPLAGPAWDAHRQVIEALDSDIRRILAEAEAQE